MHSKLCVIDSEIPFIKGVLEPYFDVVYCAGSQIDSKLLARATALITRSRTRCNSELLEGSALKFIATATIGTDHIDKEQCAKRGITVKSATGCNARAVAQWVFAALRELENRNIIDPQHLTLGIIGVGNVGREVEKMALERGITLKKCDPPRAAKGESGFVELDELLKQSDVVTLHIPLAPQTNSIIEPKFLAKLKPNATLLNSSRGEIADEKAVLEAIKLRGLNYVVDVFRDEPKINLELLSSAEIATPHIAGYSARGKATATTMSVQSIANHFHIEELKEWDCAKEYQLETPETFDIISHDTALRAEPTAFEKQRTIRD